MTTALELLTDGSDTLREFRVPGYDLTIYSKRFTLLCQKQVQRFFTEGGFDPAGIAEIVWRFALDENGARLFSRDDARALASKAPSHVLNDIAEFIIGDVRSIEEHSGNSPGGTPED